MANDNDNKEGVPMKSYSREKNTFKMVKYHIFILLMIAIFALVLFFAGKFTQESIPIIIFFGLQWVVKYSTAAFPKEPVPPVIKILLLLNINYFSLLKWLRLSIKSLEYIKLSNLLYNDFLKFLLFLYLSQKS